MRKIFYTLILAITFITSYAQESETELKQTETQKPIKLKGVIVENDYHENISWIKSKPVALVNKDFLIDGSQVTHIQIYFGLYVKDGKQYMTPIHLVNKYKSQDWIFFNQISYLFGNRKDVRMGKGKIFKITDDDTNKNVSLGVSEKSDIVADENVKDLIKYILENETDLNIRYTNSNKSEYVELDVPGGTKKLQKQFKVLIDAYNQINEAYKLNQPF